jgi:hypothetical protein
MKTSHSLALLPALVVSLALGACGGGSSTTAAVTPSEPGPTNISQAAVVQYMNNSIAATSETTSPADVNSTTLAADETSEPDPI